MTCMIFVSHFKDDFISMGVYSTGNPYGIPDDLVYSFPVQIKVKPFFFSFFLFGENILVFAQ